MKIVFPFDAKNKKWSLKFITPDSNSMFNSIIWRFYYFVIKWNGLKPQKSSISLMNQMFSNDLCYVFGTLKHLLFFFISLVCVTFPFLLQKLVLIHNSLLTVWSYFSFSDKSQDKSDHHIRARFSWSLSNEEILTPQLQDDGAVSFACFWISLNGFVSTHVKWTSLKRSFEFFLL